MQGAYSGISGMPLIRKTASEDAHLRSLWILFDADPGLGPVTMDDLRGALQVTKPSAHVYAQRFQKFHDEFGSHFD
jgi:hypothetical protein